MGLMKFVRGSIVLAGTCILGCACADKSEEEKCDDCKSSGMG